MTQLRREALLPNERSRGLGTVAVVCTMAGVASGLALATTLMAMQVADSMSVRACPYRVVETPIEVTPVGLRTNHGFLGIRYVFRNGVGEITQVLAKTPAAEIGLHAGDRVRTINGDEIRTDSELQEHIFGAPAGTQIDLVVERGGVDVAAHPILDPFPTHQP